jgi:DNA-binding NarL/FixJ family response regulator
MEHTMDEGTETGYLDQHRDAQGHAHHVPPSWGNGARARQLRSETSSRPAIPDPQVIIGTLSRRDLRLLQLLAEGLSDRSIAERLELQPQTVRKYLMQVQAKLRVESRLQAVIFALRHGLVTLD